MSDLLDDFDNGGRLEDEVEAQRLYIDAKAPCEFVARVTDYGFGTIDNKNSKMDGQSFLSVDLQVIEGPKIPLSRKDGKKYVSVDGRVGDRVSLFFPMTSIGRTAGQAKVTFREVCSLAAALSGNRPDDYYKEGNIGPQGLRTEFDDSGRHKNAKLRFVALEPNKEGYFNYRLELVPSDEVPEKAKKAK